MTLITNNTNNLSTIKPRKVQSTIFNYQVVLGIAAFSISFGLSLVPNWDFPKAFLTGIITVLATYAAAFLVDKRRRNDELRMIGSLQRRIRDIEGLKSRIVREIQQLEEYRNLLYTETQQLEMPFATGGVTSLARGGNYLDGPGDGLSDSIPATIGNRQPARLADGEFVISADVVSDIGGGSSKAGAKKLHAMMDRVRQSAHGTKKQVKKSLFFLILM
jgi:hypothetical protein